MKHEKLTLDQAIKKVEESSKLKEKVKPFLAIVHMYENKPSRRYTKDKPIQEGEHYGNKSYYHMFFMINYSEQRNELTKERRLATVISDDFQHMLLSDHLMTLKNHKKYKNTDFTIVLDFDFTNENRFVTEWDRIKEKEVNKNEQ